MKKGLAPVWRLLCCGRSGEPDDARAGCATIARRIRLGGRWSACAHVGWRKVRTPQDRVLANGQAPGRRKAS